MLFWRKIHFVVIYTLLCRAKLTQTSCLWSKSDKYHVSGSSCALFRLHTDANSILLHHLLPPPPPLTLPLPLQLPLPPPPLLLLPLRFYLFNNPQIELCKHIVINSCSCRGYLSKQGTRLKGWNRWWWCRWWSNILHRNLCVTFCNSGGGIKKKRASKWNSLSRRWFVFDRNKRTLVYYADKSEVANPSSDFSVLANNYICSYSQLPPG